MSATAVDVPVAQYPSYDDPEDLLRDLRAQGFTVSAISDGWRISSPYNDLTTVQHRGKVHGAKISDLRDMGFYPPAEFKKLKKCRECGQLFRGVQKLTQHRIDDHGYRLTCKVCGETGFMKVTDVSTHTGQAHPERTKRGRARLAAAAGETPYETAQQETEKIEEAAKPTTSAGGMGVTRPGGPGRKRSPVRKGYVEEIQAFIKLADDARDSVTALVDAYKDLYTKYQKDHKKLQDIEDRVGKLVDRF